MAGGLVTYYSINGMFATHLQQDLGLSPALIATPIIFANLVVFLASMFWGWAGDRIGRRWAMIIPGLLGHTGRLLLHAQRRLLGHRYRLRRAGGRCSRAAPAPTCRPT